MKVTIAVVLFFASQIMSVYSRKYWVENNDSSLDFWPKFNCFSFHFSSVDQSNATDDALLSSLNKTELECAFSDLTHDSKICTKEASFELINNEIATTVSWIQLVWIIICFIREASLPSMNCTFKNANFNFYTLIDSRSKQLMQTTQQTSIGCMNRWMHQFCSYAKIHAFWIFSLRCCRFKQSVWSEPCEFDIHSGAQKW